jgi:autotransporter-associated beta strand protein
VTNTAATTISGVISDNSKNCGITKTGNGSLYLNGVNTYTDVTTVSNGMLAGIGTIAGPVTVAGGTIGGGSAASIGTLTISGNLTLNGNVFARVNKSLAQSNDLVSVGGTLNGSGTGTITVSNLGPALVVGDKFALFSGAVTGAGGLTVTGGGMNWTNKLAINGTIEALSANTGPATNPTNLTFSVSGGNLNIGWPEDHRGWYLQTQTNLTSTPWADVPGSSTATNVVVPLSPTNRTLFYRLSLQP